jgi:CRP-like cAMP-binding protein
MPKNNAILSSLSESDAASLRPHLRTISLKQKEVLYEAGEIIKLVYFPLDAVVSLVVTLTDGQTTEAAMVGNDGAIGMPSAMDGKLAPSIAIVQLGGDAVVCDPKAFCRAAFQSHRLISMVMRHEQTLFAQAQQSAACVANHIVEARLCRWLLRARGLSGSDNLPFTQEFLAQLLGVGRPSVTKAAFALQSMGLITYSRGKIQIVDVERTRELACECYEVVEEGYRSLHEQNQFNR